MHIGELYAQFFSALNGCCMRLTRDRDEAEELAQEAFLRAMGDGDFPRLSPPQQRAWLMRAARRLFIDRARHRACEPPAEQPRAEEPDLTALQVAEALSRLSPEQRQLVTLRYFAGFSAQELGERLGIPAATVRTRLRAAAKILKKHYL